jgi:hypothetical protein
MLVFDIKATKQASGNKTNVSGNVTCLQQVILLREAFFFEGYSKVLL